MKNIALILSGFVLYYIGLRYVGSIMAFLEMAIPDRLLCYFLANIIIGLPVFIATCLVNKDLHFFRHLGLQSNILKGLLLGILFSLPMFIGGLIQSELANDMDVRDLMVKTVLAGLFEELYFRGFFFGQLFRKTRLGFLPAILLCSLVFASGHLYQSQQPEVLLGVFMTTFMGSVLFAWLYVEWNYNLWVPVFLHILMNLSWYIFAVSDNALGTVDSNVFRAITIALSIILTLIYKKRRSDEIRINKSTLLIKKENR